MRRLIKSIINSFHSQSIRQKVLAFGVVMSTIPLLLISYFYYTQVKLDLEERIIETQKLLTQNLSNEISLEFTQVLQQIQMLATLSQFEGNKRGYYELLQQNETIEEIVITDNQGNVEQRISRYQLNLPDNKESWFTDEMWYKFQFEDYVYGEVEFNQFGQPIMKLAIPTIIKNDRKGIGVIIQLQKIIGQISSLRQDYSSYLYLLDQNGKVIAHQDYSKLWKKSEQKSSVNDSVLSVKHQIDELGWTLVMEQPRGTAFAPIDKLFQTGLVVVLVVTLIISLISIYAGLYFTKPILLLNKGIKNLQKGKSISPIQLEQKDEIGLLAQSFNEMAKELQKKSLQIEMEKERLDIVVNGIGAGLGLVGKDYQITWMNPTLKKWFQTKEFPLLCYTLIEGKNSPCLDCPITDRNYKGGSVNRTFTYNERIYQHRVFPLNHSIAGEGEFLVVIEDITEQKTMEEKIIQTDKLSALGLMASSFAHEVNNPLTTINVYAEDLNDRLQMKDADLDDEEISMYLEKIVENTNRCKKITSNLLNFSRKSQWNNDSIHIESTIQNSINLLEHTLKKKSIQVHLKIEKPLPMIEGDGLKLMQVFVNVINNAMDAMERGGILTISAYMDGDKINIAFQDTGCGIPKEELSKVYDPFYTTKPIGKGTGLGLSVCYGIIQQFAGSMEIASEVGEGTTVSFELPIKEESKWAQNY